MLNKVEQITEDLEVTKQDLSSKIEKIEEHVKSSIQETKDKFSDKVHAMKEATNIANAVEKSPLLVVGGASIAGFALSYYLLGRKTGIPLAAKAHESHGSRSPFLEKLAEEFRPQLKVAKGLALHSLASIVGSWAAEKFPNFEGEIKQMVESTNLNQNAAAASHNVTTRDQKRTYSDSKTYTELPEDTYKNTLV